MNAVYQQVDVTGFPQFIDELLLHFIQIVQPQFARRLWWRSQQAAFGCALIKSLKSGVINRLADGAAAVAAECVWLSPDLCVHFFGCRNRQCTVKTALIGTARLLRCTSH